MAFDVTTLVHYDDRDMGYERGESLTWNYRMTDIKMLGHLNEKMERFREITSFMKWFYFSE